MSEFSWSAADLDQFRRHGLKTEDVEHHLAFFRNPPAGLELDRPCRIGDGIVQIDEIDWPRLERLYATAADLGRFSKFVPASGAATRMFNAAMAVVHQEAGPTEMAAVTDLIAQIELLPFADEWLEAATKRNVERDDVVGLLELLLTERGLDFGHRAKALIPFHRHAGGARSALEEHLEEAVQHLRDGQGSCKVHFTIPQHQELIFRDHFRAIQGRLESRFGAIFDVGWSAQNPATDVIAADQAGQPFRLDDGSLLLRPGGHGALLGNLAEMGGDLIFIRNIDNVLPAARRAEVLRWNRLLGGYLLQLEQKIEDVLDYLEQAEEGGAWLDDALRQVAELLDLPEALAFLDRRSSEKREFLRHRLDRPLRVCAVVANKGEPGGGPFWVRDGRGKISRQIVEAAQIHREIPGQAEILANASHFNPVHMICRLRDKNGTPYDLKRFVDPATVFISQKSLQGRSLQALEHPGLWNGSMARWNTVFVEVPASIFAPVKTVFDLLRPEHQA
jgi:Domain of unknown function (DUF4301)